MRRRDFIGVGAGAVGVAAASAIEGVLSRAEAAPASRERQSRPHNLILFFTDEMRADALACYGNPVTKTPNFDLLAKQGALFQNCHVQNPVCAQSRCSMLTGWPTSVRGHRSLYYLLQRDEPNLFRYLRQAGYDVFWFGKNDALTPDAVADSVTMWKDMFTHGAFAGSAPKNMPPAMLFPPYGDRRAGLDYPMLQLAFKVLERRETDRPFCIFLPLFEPHPPYMAPRDFVDMYNPSALPPLAPPGLPRKPNYHAALRQALKLDQVDDATFRKVRATYYAQVSYSDWMLGELMEAIDRTGHAKDTALFAASDHGDYAGDYGLVEKWPSGLETCLTHVPLIARVPGGTPGVVAPDMVELYDIMATFLALGGTRATHTNFARSLMPQIMGGPGDPNRAAFTEGGYNIYEPQAFEPRLPGLYGPKTNLQNDRPETIQRAAAVKTQRYSYVERPGGVSELYDRKHDPMEENNLIDSRSHAKVRNDMQTRLVDWYINTTGVPGEIRDGRDLPDYVPNPEFPDAAKRTREILDD